MTTVPKSGDSDSRYEIRYVWCETGEDRVYGWANQLVTAEKIRCCLMVGEGIEDVRIIDRGVSATELRATEAG